MLDGLVDGIERSAPQPRIIVQIGIAEAALRTTPMAGRAIVAEGRLAAGKGEVQEFGIGVDRGKIAAGDLLPEAGLGGLGLIELLGHHLSLAVAQPPFGVARHERPGRHQQPIAHRPDDGGVEHIKPPFGQRLV